MRSLSHIHSFFAHFSLLLLINQINCSGMIEMMFLSPETVLLSSTICTRYRCNSINTDARKVKLNPNVSLRIQEAPYNESPKYYDIHLAVFDTEGERIGVVFNSPESDVTWKENRIITNRGFNITYKYRSICDSNYYGTRCNHFCQESKELHTECSPSGEKRCMLGWTGPFCMTPICENSCSGRGKCVSPGQCQCMSGYTGANCEECVPKKGCVHGGCAGNVSFTCACEEGYGGPLCTFDLEMCRRERPCLNGGTCSNIGTRGYKCQCPEGFMGKQCEIPVESVRCKHETAENVCMNDGICISLDGKTMQCKCPNGFSGRLCEISNVQNGDQCAHFQCKNGGICEIGEDMNPRCVCDTCYKGNRCEILDAGCLVSHMNATIHATHLRKSYTVQVQGGISYECFIVIVSGFLLVAAILIFAFLTRMRTKKDLLPTQSPEYTSQSENSQKIFKVCSDDNSLQKYPSPPPAYSPPSSKTHYNIDKKPHYQILPTTNNLSSIFDNCSLKSCNV